MPTIRSCDEHRDEQVKLCLRRARNPEEGPRGKGFWVRQARMFHHAKLAERRLIVINNDYGGFNLSDNCKVALRARGVDLEACLKIDRENPELIKLILKYGSYWASGDRADLKIVAIPYEVDWEIKNYDGNEWVAEAHRTWS